MDDQELSPMDEVLNATLTRRQVIKAMSGLGLGGLGGLFNMGLLPSAPPPRLLGQSHDQVVNNRLQVVNDRLQTEDLVMGGLNVFGDQPPNTLQPRLDDGVHLRWVFRRDLGFPWYGFYLFRRPHFPGTSVSVLPEEKKAENLFRRIEVEIGFLQDSTIEITALLSGSPIGLITVTGRAHTSVIAQVEFDAMTDIEISPGPVVLTGLRFVPVTQNATAGWESLGEQPIRLPLKHPDYPCPPYTNMPEDFEDSRSTASRRVRYGSPNDVAGFPTNPYEVGRVSVAHGSPIVLGTNTDWNESHVGSVLQVGDDDTVYTILSVQSLIKLTLSRGYTGGNGSSRPYKIHNDVYGQFYDHLVHLVQGGPDAEPMASRVIPPIINIGTIAAIIPDPGFVPTSKVIGNSTNWDSTLGGAALRVVEYNAGTISVVEGSPFVTGTGTTWTASLVGKSLHVAGEGVEYNVVRVDSSTRLMLARNYSGDTDTGLAYTIAQRDTFTIISVEAPTSLKVRGRYLGPDANNKPYIIVPKVGPPPSQTEPTPPEMPITSPLDMVLLASLYPPYAQMAGLYWVDDTALPDTAYDYLIVGDYSGVGVVGGSQAILATLQSEGFERLYGYITFKKMKASSPPLAPPRPPTVYEIPDYIAGLKWDSEDFTLGPVAEDHPLMYHVWRVDHGPNEPPSEPNDNLYRPLTVDADGSGSPLLFPKAPADLALVLMDGWPDSPLQYIDGGLADGWYSYKISSITIFGKHSIHSLPGPWYRWTPPPNPPQVHPFAVHIQDKMPPPPPTAIEAYAIDLRDPMRLQDQAYNDWMADLESTGWYSNLIAKDKQSIIGLRVSWIWTLQHMAQAPDAREFRIYFHPGRLNTLQGNVTSVTPLVGGSSVSTDISITPTPARNAYAGAILQVGDDSFTILGSIEGNPLRLSLKNIGPTDNIYPSDNKPCSIFIPPTYVSGTVSVVGGSRSVNGHNTNWSANLGGMPFRIVDDLEVYTVSRVNTPTQLELDRPYMGGTGDTKMYSIRFPAYTDYSQATHWQQRFFINAFDEHFTLDSAGNRHYVRFFPDPDDTFHDSPLYGGLNMSTSSSDDPPGPLVYAHIGVSAADDKTHTLDDPVRALERWGNRYGNEGRVAGPAKIFRVHRDLPAPPQTPPASLDPIYATPADYQSQSFYTYRWLPAKGMKVHVTRALDESVFMVDWALRTRDPRPALSDADLASFPAELRGPEFQGSRQEVAAALNQLNTPPGPGQDPMARYRGLSNLALWTLAGLPGNEEAFTQVTIQPLDPNDPANADRRGPDDPKTYVPNAGLRAYMDTLDGRSTSRYFYRALYVDGVHNRSGMSQSSPPIHLPNVIPPRAPSITKVLGGDRAVVLYWSSNRELDLAKYRVYRTDNEVSVRDIRLMTLVHTEAVPAGDPLGRPAQVTWTDAPLPGLVMFYYRLVAVDGTDNVSEPSLALAARAFDEAPPVPPTLTAAWVGNPGREQAEVSWASTDQTRLERRIAGGGVWFDVALWQPAGSYTIRDPAADPANSYEYRISSRKYTGATAIGPAVTLDAIP
jgi:hypothetical protein